MTTTITIHVNTTSQIKFTRWPISHCLWVSRELVDCYRNMQFRPVYYQLPVLLVQYSGHMVGLYLSDIFGDDTTILVRSSGFSAQRAPQ